ncbi:hypothetical protein LTR94_026529 [Friedmanniomyces endolithicus]|nr:hypothetical protein LTR94_026529 [Friedmanniomyces endolithicus]
MGANALNAILVERLGVDRLLLVGALGSSGFGAAAILVGLSGWGGLGVLAATLCGYCAMSGLIVANSIAGGLSRAPDRVGAASALVGAIHYGSGVVGSALVDEPCAWSERTLRPGRRGPDAERGASFACGVAIQHARRIMNGEVSRRGLAVLPAALVAVASCVRAQEPQRSKGDERVAAPAAQASTLVAFVTRSGNTRVIAKTLQQRLQADLYEIRRAVPYPEDYEAHVREASREREAGMRPELAQSLDVAAYSQIYLGFPVWGGSLPAIVRSFLARHDLAGKQLRPFITHGGFGPGDCLERLRSEAVGADIGDPFVLEADQERRTINQVMAWV